MKGTKTEPSKYSNKKCVDTTYRKYAIYKIQIQMIQNPVNSKKNSNTEREKNKSTYYDS